MKHINSLLIMLPLSSLSSKVDKTTRINGKPLTSDIELTKSDLDLDEVENISLTSISRYIMLNLKMLSESMKKLVPLLSSKVDKYQKINNKQLTADLTLTKVDIGLSEVDNTSDVNKPLSTSMISELSSRIKNLLSVDSSLLISGLSPQGEVSLTLNVSNSFSNEVLNAQTINQLVSGDLLKFGNHINWTNTKLNRSLEVYPLSETVLGVVVHKIPVRLQLVLELICNPSSLSGVTLSVIVNNITTQVLSSLTSSISLTIDCTSLNVVNSLKLSISLPPGRSVQSYVSTLYILS